MRVLVTWGSKLGGTAGISTIIAETLTARGHDVVAVPASDAPSPDRFDAVIIGGALYANRWPREVRRFVERHVDELARVPTWMFSSGPLDDSADRAPIPPPRWLSALIARTGGLGHQTFGGRLEAGVKGFPAEAMAKKNAGDWRNPARIRAWANEVADELPTARPHPVNTPEGRSPVRLVEYGVVGWAVAAATLVIATALAPLWFALTLHAVVMPAWFASLAVRYQQVEGARAPLLVAFVWVGITGAIELALVAHTVRAHLALAHSVAGLWLPLGLSFVVIWAAGAIAAMLPLSTDRQLAPVRGAS